MKKITFFILSVLIALSVAISQSVAFGLSDADLTGSWTFEVPNAPWEYSNGHLVFGVEEEELSGKIKFHTGRELTIRSITVEEYNVVFVVFVDGYRVETKLTLDGNLLTGYAETPEGNMNITAEREISEG